MVIIIIIIIIITCGMLDKLKEVDLSSKDVVAVHLFVSNMADFAAINFVYKNFFGVNPPVRFVKWEYMFFHYSYFQLLNLLVC